MSGTIFEGKFYQAEIYIVLYNIIFSMLWLIQFQDDWSMSHHWRVQYQDVYDGIPQ